MASDRKQTPLRWDESTYKAASAAATTLGMSLNSFTNHAVESYLASSEFEDEFTQARQRNEEAIKRLSGDENA